MIKFFVLTVLHKRVVEVDRESFMTSVISKALTFCSGPFWPDKANARTTITTEFVKLILQKLISVLPSTGNHSSELLSVLSELLSKPVLRCPTWTPSIGHAYRVALQPKTHDPIAAATNLVLEFLEEIPSISFCCEFKHPKRLIVEPVILPETSHISFSWAPPDLQLTAPGYLACFSISESCRALKTFSSTKNTSPSTSIKIGFLNVLTDSRGSAFLPLDLTPTVINSTDCLFNLKTAEEILREITPEYIEWMTPMIRYLVPTAAPHNGFTSGSDRFNPGVVTVSFPIDAVSLAESLVHETAHQYYFLANCISNLTDPLHDQLYYSSFTRTLRPLDKILLAYHAAANILCLYQLLICRGSSYQPSRSSLVCAVRDFETLAKHLIGNAGLTDLGCVLFEPIYNLIINKQWNQL